MTDKSKQCARCDEIKPLEVFYRNAARPDGRADYCKECERQNWETRERRDRNEREVILPELAKHWISRPLIPANLEGMSNGN